MCIITNGKPKIYIAEKDIEVIKVLSYKNTYFEFLFFKFRRHHYISPYKNKKYRLNKIYKSRISFDQYEEDDNKYVTKDGLYSFDNEDSITTNFAFYPIQPSYFRGIFRAVIPKGAKYYTNGKGEFCSDSLKVLSYKKDLNVTINYKTGKIIWWM